MEKQIISQLSDVIFTYYPTIRKAFRGLVSIKPLPISMTQLTCLHAVVQNGSMTMSELATELDMSNQQLTKVVKAIVKFGMAKRTVEPKNKRKINVTPTQKGINTIDNLKEEVQTKMAILSSRVSDETMMKLYQNLMGLKECVDAINEK